MSQNTSSPLLWLLRFFARLPMHTLQGLARLLANISLLFPTKGVSKTVRRNLLIAFPDMPEAERNQIAAESVRSQAMSMLEFIKSWGNPPEYSIAQIRAVHGEQLFLDGLKNPNGLIAMMPHHGSWELMNAWANQHAAPTIMYKPVKEAAMNTFVLEARSRLNATLVPTDESGVRSIFRTLKKGGFSAILPDHVPEESGGILSRFFGHKVMTTTLISRLAEKTGCSVVLMYCLRCKDGDGFEIFFEPVDDRIRSKDLQESVDVMNQTIEALIRRDPAQYHWAYKRFKDAPHFRGIYHKTDEEVREILATKDLVIEHPSASDLPAAHQPPTI